MIFFSIVIKNVLVQLIIFLKKNNKTSQREWIDTIMTILERYINDIDISKEYRCTLSRDTLLRLYEIIKVPNGVFDLLHTQPASRG